MISVASFRRDYGYIYKGEPVLPDAWQAAFNTIIAPGQIFGGFAASWAADRVGRKYSLLAGIIFSTGGAVGEILSRSHVLFLMLKLILGFGLGFYLTLAPLMTSELALVSLRGFATAGVNLGIAIGQLLSNAVVKVFSERDDSWAYAGVFSTQLFFSLFLILPLAFSLESPWYLV